MQMSEKFPAKVAKSSSGISELLNNTHSDMFNRKLWTSGNSPSVGTSYSCSTLGLVD